MNKIKMAVIGIGQRGSGMTRTLLNCEEVDVTYICDIYEDRCLEGVKIVEEIRKYTPKYTTNYKDILADDSIDAVLISTPWNTHTDIAIAAMKAHKACALEVYGAYSIEECWKLVEAYEETKTPFMFLENCCYDKFELLSTSLVRAGKLGQVVHCSGAYAHDLRDEITGGRINRHYRLKEYSERNCENYPTHELGPIAKLLNINRGNRMVSMVSFASKPGVGLEEYVKEGRSIDETLKDRHFNQSDIITTMIKCENGETISLRLDTTLPRFYDRAFTVRGTKGLTNQTLNMIFLEEEQKGEEYWENGSCAATLTNNANKEEYKEYLPPVWKNITDEEMALGHGGMDFIELKEFVKHLINKEEMPIDVYDAASWMAITALSAESIAEGGTLKQIPDFTKGAYKTRKPKDVIEL